MDIEHILNEVERERRRQFVGRQLADFVKLEPDDSVLIERIGKYEKIKILSALTLWGLDTEKINLDDNDNRKEIKSSLMNKFLNIEQAPEIEIDFTEMEREYRSTPNDPTTKEREADFIRLKEAIMSRPETALIDVQGVGQQRSFNDVVELINRYIITNPEEAIRLYSQAWRSRLVDWVNGDYNDPDVRERDRMMRAILSQALPSLSSVIDDVYSNLIGKALANNQFSRTRSNGIKAFLDLIDHNPKIALDIYMKNFGQLKTDSNPIDDQQSDIDIETLKYVPIPKLSPDIGPQLRLNFLMKWYRTALKDTIAPVEDSEYKFIRDYLKSRQVHVDGNITKPLRKAEEVLSELVRLVCKVEQGEPSKEAVNYGTAIQIVQVAKAKNLDEIIECATIASKDFIAVSKLGSGAAGTTYLVEHAEMGKLALKILREKKTTAEAAIIDKLNRLELHPNIVKVRYAGSDFVRTKEGTARAILMDYIDGPTLEVLMQENPQGLKLGEAIDYSLQLLDGIRFLRANKIFHRDLNPANVKRDNTGTIKIMDFGIAVEDLEAEPQDNRKYGGNSDLFSWGLMAYEMITGQHPVLPKTASMGKQTHTERIKELKKEMRDGQGRLTPEYMKKINETIPKKLRKPIIQALEYHAEYNLENIVKQFEKYKDKNRTIRRLMYGIGLAIPLYFILANWTSFPYKDFAVSEYSPKIEQVIVQPMKTYALEPVTLRAEGKHLMSNDIEWYITSLYAPERRVNRVETKMVFPVPGTYSVGCYNQGLMRIQTKDMNMDTSKMINQLELTIVERPKSSSAVPEAVIDCTEAVTTNQTLFIDASKSRDKDGKIESYFIQFGDGNYEEGKVEDLQSLRFAHRYDQEDPNFFARDEIRYEVLLAIYDNSGGAGYAAKQILVRKRTINSLTSSRQRTRALRKGAIETESVEINPVYNPNNSHWYALNPEEITWEDAELAARRYRHQDLAGHLATITSKEEMEWVRRNIRFPRGADDRAVQVWLGAHQVPAKGLGIFGEGKDWVWVTGEKWKFTPWTQWEPNNSNGIEDYLGMYPQRSCEWNDNSNDANFPSLVEFEK